MGKGSRTPSFTHYVPFLLHPTKEVEQPYFEIPEGKQEEEKKEIDTQELIDIVEEKEIEEVEKFEELEEHDEDEEESHSEDDKLFYLEESYLNSSQLFNYKRNGLTMRSSKHNKKEKVKVERYISHIQQLKQQKKQDQLSYHYERHVRCTGTSCSSRSSRRNDNRDEQEDIQRAMRESARQYASTYGLTEQQFLDIQSRELTPEDYELLLLLDNSVKPKTLNEQIVHDFPTSKVAELGETCRVCLTEYEIGDLVKTLPCGHHFHLNCINTWLTSSSVNCPIDGLPVTK